MSTTVPSSWLSEKGVCEKAFVHTCSLQVVEGFRLEIILGQHCHALQRDEKGFQRLIGRIALIGEGNSLRAGALTEHCLSTALTLAHSAARSISEESKCPACSVRGCQERYWQVLCVAG